MSPVRIQIHGKDQAIPDQRRRGPRFRPTNPQTDRTVTHYIKVRFNPIYFVPDWPDWFDVLKMRNGTTDNMMFAHFTWIEMKKIDFALPYSIAHF